MWLSKRIVFILAITGVGVIASFTDAFYGLLLYTFYSFVSPLELTWGGLAGARFSFMVGGVVILSALMQRRNIFPKHVIAYLCILFLFFCLFSLAVRIDVHPNALTRLGVLTKIILMALVAAVLIRTPDQLRLYVLAIAVFVGLLGAYYGVFGLFAGSMKISGPGRIGDNNGYAVLLNATLPFIYYAGIHLKRIYLKLLAKIVLLANILAVILTFSRGGFITLIIVIALLIFSTRKKWLLFLLLFMACFTLFFMWQNNDVPSAAKAQIAKGKNSGEQSIATKTIELWRQRMETLKQPAEEIETARSRIYFWEVAMDMGNANPLTGVGFAHYQREFKNYDKTGGLYGGNRAVHNIFLSLLSEIGYIGTLVFVLLIFVCLDTTFKITRRMRWSRNYRLTVEFTDYAKMLRISLAAFFIGGFFVDTLFQEIFWAIISLSIAMDNLSKDILINQDEIQM